MWNYTFPNDAGSSYSEALGKGKVISGTSWLPTGNRVTNLRVN